MRCTRKEPHARHSLLVEGVGENGRSGSMPFECEGVDPPPQSPREVMEKAVGGRIESK